MIRGERRFQLMAMKRSGRSEKRRRCWLTVSRRYSGQKFAILVPSPDRLIKDEFVARLIRLPVSTFQINGIDLSLKKHPAKSFNSHLLRVSLLKKPDWLLFQVTTMKDSGNFTVSFDALGRYSLAVENLGAAGRKINLFTTGEKRDRLNLEWVWSREHVSLPEKIRGLNGVLHIQPAKRHDFRNFVRWG